MKYDPFQIVKYKCNYILSNTKRNIKALIYFAVLMDSILIL